MGGWVIATSHDMMMSIIIMVGDRVSINEYGCNVRTDMNRGLKTVMRYVIWVHEAAQ